MFFCMTSAVYGAEIGIIQGSVEEVSFRINNDYPEPMLYSIYSIGWHPWIFFSYSQIMLSPGELEDIKIFLIPNQEVKQGVYDIHIVAESINDKLTKNLKVRVLEVIIKPEIKSFFFDNKKIQIHINSSEDLKAKLEIYKEEKLLESVDKIIPVGESEISKNLNLDTGNYIAKLKIYRQDTLIDKIERRYSNRFISGMIQKKDEWNLIILSNSKITFENNGDLAERKVYELLVDKSKDSFFNAANYYSRQEGENTVKYTWDFTLQPNQKYVVAYSYNYSTLSFLFLAIALLGVLIYLSVKKDVKLKKDFAGRVSGIREGKKIEICVEVINKTKYELSNIIIRDYVQPIFELKRKFNGVKPVKITKIKEELKLVWTIPRLEPRETRIFSYTIVPKIGVGDTYSFSLAEVQYKRDKVRKIVFSNSLKTGE